jgi:hypothetical protein
MTWAQLTKKKSAQLEISTVFDTIAAACLGLYQLQSGAVTITRWRCQSPASLTVIWHIPTGTHVLRLAVDDRRLQKPVA